MNVYLDKSLKNIKINLSLFLASLLIFTIWYLFRIGNLFPHSYLYISIGHVGYFFLLLIPGFCAINNGLTQKLWIFFLSLTLLDLTPLMYIVNNKDVDASIFLSSIMFSIIIFLLLISMLYGISSINSISSKINPKNILYIFASSLFFILLYHGTNYYLKIYKNIPNEERSIFFNGLEFHHINYGLALLPLVPFLYQYAFKVNENNSLLIYIFIGFIYGTIFDESFYYMLSNMSDDAYLYPSIFAGQIIFMFFVFTYWYYLSKRRRKA